MSANSDRLIVNRLIRGIARNKTKNTQIKIVIRFLLFIGLIFKLNNVQSTSFIGS